MDDDPVYFHRYTRRRRRRKTTLSDLSGDLLIEILSRLPVKSIIRCTCLCRSYLPLLSLLTDSRFIKLHFDRHHLRPPNLLLTTSYSSPTSFQTLDFPYQKTKNLNPNFSPESQLKVIGSSCNGFFCLSNDTGFICLFNPTTQEHIQLPNHPDLKHSSRVVLGFSFEPVANDYKVIRFLKNFPAVYSFMVYSLKSKLWSKTNVKSIDALLPKSNVLNVYNAAHVKGILHWACVQVLTHSMLISVLSFSLVTEKFREFSCPRGLKGFSYDLCLGVWEGCLAIFDTIPYKRVDIWLMMDYGIEESWTRVSSIRFDMIHVNPLMYRVLHPLQLCKDGKILLQMGGAELILYDPMDKISIVPVIGGAPDFFRATTYAENLTSVASLM